MNKPKTVEEKLDFVIGMLQIQRQQIEEEILNVKQLALECVDECIEAAKNGERECCRTPIDIGYTISDEEK